MEFLRTSPHSKVQESKDIYGNLLTNPWKHIEVTWNEGPPPLSPSLKGKIVLLDKFSSDSSEVQWPLNIFKTQTCQ